jgi:hypothetical protein
MDRVASETPPKIWKLALLAWASAYSAFRRAPLLFVAVLISLAVIVPAAAIPAAVLAKVHLSGWLAGVGLTIAGMLIGLLRMALVGTALAPMAIAINRFVVLGETPTRAACFGNARWRLFAWWLIGFQIFNAIGQLPAMIYGAAGTFGLAVVALIATGVITLRSALLFPAIATDEPGGSVKERVELSWRQTDGVSLRLIFALLLAELPFLLVSLLVGQLATYVAAHWVPARLHALPLGVAGLIGAILAFAGLAVAVAVIAWVYLWVMDHPLTAKAATPE